MRASIVGNGSCIKGKLNGYMVDDADDIIRLNNATIKGFEYDVGYRTTIRFISMPCSIDGSDFESTLKNEILKIIWVNPFLMINNINKVLTYNRVEILSKSFLDYCNRQVGNYSLRRQLFKSTVSPTKKFASSGLIAILWALERYDEVNIFGFNFFSGDESNYHYWEAYPQKHNPNKWHDFEKEKQIILRLRDENRINLF